MRVRLPSTMSLRIFEAAARHLSFTRAAIEVNLTQTAVSHQIRKLEEQVGCLLFERRGSALALTTAGEEYLVALQPALLSIAEATDRLTLKNDEHILTVQSLGTFAIKSLLPELSDFQTRFPAFSLRLRTVQLAQTRLATNFDLAIWHGSGQWSGLEATQLARDDIFPVCSPALLKNGPPLNRPEDLAQHTVIRYTTGGGAGEDEWPFWLKEARLPTLEFNTEISCDFMITALQAAIDGVGVAMGRSTVVKRDIMEGRLVAPFGIRAPSLMHYHLVYQKNALDRLKVRCFRDWLLEKMGSQHSEG